MQINQVSEECAERRREMQINPGQLQKYIGICRICRYPRDAPQILPPHTPPTHLHVFQPCRAHSSVPQPPYTVRAWDMASQAVHSGHPSFNISSGKGSEAKRSDALGDPGRHRQTQADTDRLRQTRKTPKSPIKSEKVRKSLKKSEKSRKSEKSEEVRKV